MGALMICTKAHYRRLVAKLGGIDGVQSLTGRKRQTIAAYHNQDNAQEPTASLMLELQAAAQDFAYQRACNASLGIGAEQAIMDWREANAKAFLNGEHDQKFFDAVTPEKLEAAE